MSPNSKHYIQESFFITMKKFLIFTSFCALFALFLGCERVDVSILEDHAAPTEVHENVISEDHARTLKIGFMVAGDRTSYLNGAEMAVAEINANGGLLGNTVELLTYVNMDSKLQDSLSVAEKWIREDEVIALIGPNRSTHAIEVGKIAQRHKIPMVTTTASNPNVTNAGDFVFMASVTDNFQIGIMAQLARETLDITTAALITRQSDLYTEGISEFFRLSFHDLGGEIVANEFYEGDMLDFTAALTTIAETKPDALFISGFFQDVARITQQARAIPLQNLNGEPTIFLGSDSWDNDLLLTHEDAKLEGSFFPGHFSPDTDDPTAQAFVSSYQAIYHQIPTGGVGVCYDAVKIFFQAVERAQTLDADAIRQQLAETQNYAGATRIGAFNEQRHPAKSVAIFEIKNGKKQFLQQINP